MKALASPMASRRRPSSTRSASVIKILEIFSQGP
ncbi:hypothetical protein EYF80_018011 [Liparis tanakae]|uniref:Uncharacterized protein n=1 Tax=Liparis tanakae TaxID=230148 RepID=A0A4Z2I1X9_9TELE|nr:hypothetical protein EYF80_018011 [Liparis tanakae]